MRVHPRRVCVQAGEQLEAADGLPDIHVPAIGGWAADEPCGPEQRRFERHVDDLRDPHLGPKQSLGDREWRGGVAGNCNLVAYNGEDAVGIAVVPYGPRIEFIAALVNWFRENKDKLREPAREPEPSMVLVPREPTPDMIECGWDALMGNGAGMEDAYRAMLAAAKPSNPSE